MALEIRRQRDVDESEHARRFTRHAGEMNYPQLREKLLHIAAEETEHANCWLKKYSTLAVSCPKLRESERQPSKVVGNIF